MIFIRSLVDKNSKTTRYHIPIKTLRYFSEISPCTIQTLVNQLDSTGSTTWKMTWLKFPRDSVLKSLPIVSILHWDHESVTFKKLAWSKSRFQKLELPSPNPKLQAVFRDVCVCLCVRVCVITCVSFWFNLTNVVHTNYVFTIPNYLNKIQ